MEENITLSKVPLFPDKYLITPLVIIIDCTDEEAEKRADQINDWLRKILQETAKYEEPKHTTFLTRILVVSDTITVRTARREKIPKLDLKSGNGCSVYQAISVALDELEDIITLCKQHAAHYTRSLLYLVSMDRELDASSDASAAERLRDYIDRKKVLYFPIRINPVKNTLLMDLYPDEYCSDMGASLDTPVADIVCIQEDDARMSDIWNNAGDIACPTLPSSITIGI